MEKVPNTTLEYHAMVWRKANHEAKKFVFSDKRVMAGNVILAIATELSTSRLLDYLSNTMSIHPIVHFFALVIGTTIGFLALYGFRITSNGLWVIPATLYKEKRVIADKLTWNDINVNLKKYGENSIFAYGISFESKKPFILNHIIAEMTWHRQDYEYKSTSRLPLIYGKQYVWDEGIIDDKGGNVVFSLFNVYRDYPETENFRAYMPKSGQPNDRDCSLDIVSTMQDKTFIEITFSCAVENEPIEKIKRNFKAWFDGNKFFVEEYKES